MPRRATGQTRDEQLRVRWTLDDPEVLAAIAHLEAVTPNAYAARLLSARIDRLRRQPHVAADIANQRGYAKEETAIPVDSGADPRRSGG